MGNKLLSFITKLCISMVIKIMRIKNSLLNYLSGIATKIISLILNFISRTVFINILGISYLGVNGLMTNVLSLLNLAELGIGTAITFSLYKPIANNDNKKIIILMNFYKKAYRIIGIIVFLVGLILLLFIDLIIKDSGDIENLKLIFLIYILIVSFPLFY
ncbi:O-antigen/teichoic acid export membrane protein [Bacillus sp. SLBN-46]|nr:O-antigen/teichoic acid export membrane protein [Bacillus sp. SLBN-46]